MEMLLAKLVLLILVGNVVISCLTPVIILGVNYVWRYEHQPYILEMVKIKVFGKDGWKERPESYWDDMVGLQAGFYAVVAMVTFIAGFIFKISTGGAGGFSQDMMHGFSYVWTLVLVLLSLPLLRWLVDISRNLKIKSSTGDSEKLEKLQQQVDDLMREAGQNDL